MSTAQQPTWDTIKDELQPLFRKTRAFGLWFHCAYQDLWFSPRELETAQNEGRFRWGSVNWTLRDPDELIQEAEHAVHNAKIQLQAVKDRVAKEKGQ